MAQHSFKHLKKRFNESVQRLFESIQSNLDDQTGISAYERGQAAVFDRMSSLLPYGYEIDPGLFTIDNATGTDLEGIGYVLELIPQTGATPAMAEHLTALTQSRGVVVNHAGLWSQRLRFEPGRDYHHLLEPRKSSTGSRYLSSTKLPPFIIASNTGSSLGSNPLSFIMTHTASRTALSNGFSLFLSIHPRM